MVAGPEVARVIEEFDVNCLDCSHHNASSSNLKHHEHTAAVQSAFAKMVEALVRVIDEMGNPFTEESCDLLVLDTRDIADPAVAETVRTIKKTGQEQYETYMAERVTQRTTPVSDPISRNKLPLFSRPPTRLQTKSKQILSSLKSDCALFLRLYISCQTRDGDLHNFFRHENHAYPPSLSQLGKLRFGTKDDLAECLEAFCTLCEEPHQSMSSYWMVLQ
ncbi:hypothetical protein BSL78_28625 [Apostichopus japonicus]|uniref:Uncharacterized protein n=1 Tax=Stichopus japonicus TaxID=307972 RepID=A0A2G8JFM3_STIJA|nr:hypothetical protein BSL78_28625 [Apostichopus japonicus]